MKVKTILLTAAVALMLGACTTASKKSGCASGECPMTKASGCADCQKAEEKTGK